MKRIMTIAVIALMLSACGGGAGQSTSPLPSAGSPSGGAAQSRTIKISIKVPAKTQQLHRRAFVSPSTQGLGFLYSTNALTYSPSAPPLTQTAAIALTGCPVQTCVTNADGSQTYNVSVTLPAGNGYLIVSLWDQVPSSATTFPAGANVLSDDVLSSAQYGGSPTQTLNITMYGVPASVAVLPYAGQTHLLPDAAGFSVVGSGCEYFTATPLDADGNPIVGDATAPALSTITASNGYETCGTTSGIVGVRPTAATSGTFTASFALNASSGLASVSGSVNLVAIQELWVPAWGATPNGLLGFTLDPSNGYKPSATPFDFINLGSANPQLNTIDSIGDQWYFDNASITLNGYYAAQGSQAPAQILSTALSANGVTLNALTGDSTGNLWLAQTTSGTYQNGAIEVIPLFFQGGTPPTVTTGTPNLYTTYNTSGPVISMSGLPPNSPAPSSYGGAVFVATPQGLYACVISGGLLCNQISTTVVSTVAADGAGHLWTYNENGDSLLHVYTIAGSFPSPSLTPIASTTISPNVGSSEMAGTAQGSVWIVNVDATPSIGINEFVLSGNTIVSGGSLPGTAVFHDGVYGVAVAP